MLLSDEPCTNSVWDPGENADEELDVATPRNIEKRCSTRAKGTPSGLFDWLTLSALDREAVANSVCLNSGSVYSWALLRTRSPSPPPQRPLSWERQRRIATNSRLMSSAKLTCSVMFVSVDAEGVPMGESDVSMQWLMVYRAGMNILQNEK